MALFKQHHAPLNVGLLLSPSCRGLGLGTIEFRITKYDTNGYTLVSGSGNLSTIKHKDLAQLVKDQAVRVKR